MTKAETIKQHYITEFINSGMELKEAEQKWEYSKEFINPDDGYFQNREEYYRPISLRGIETNNGWTSILSEKDLPSADSHTLFEICVKGKNKGFLVDAEFIRKADSSIKITHYKKHEPTADPIF